MRVGHQVPDRSSVRCNPARENRFDEGLAAFGATRCIAFNDGASESAEFHVVGIFDSRVRAPAVDVTSTWLSNPCAAGSHTVISAIFIVRLIPG